MVFVGGRELTELGLDSVLVIEYGTYGECMGTSLVAVAQRILMTDDASDNSSSVTTVYPGYNGLLNETHLFSIPSVPQPGLGNRVIQVVVAKMLGGMPQMLLPLLGVHITLVMFTYTKTATGSSGVNGLGVHRGTKEDYDRWGSFFPRPAWGWNTVLPYFKKASLLRADFLLHDSLLTGNHPGNDLYATTQGACPAAQHNHGQQLVGEDLSHLCYLPDVQLALPTLVILVPPPLLKVQ